MKILKMQDEIQTMFSAKDNHSMLHPKALKGKTVGEAKAYILAMRDFLVEEIDEIVLAMANDDKAIKKPWSSRFEALNNAEYQPNDKTQSESLDMLCFAMNILLACGIDAENVEEQYQAVYDKNVARINNGY